MDPRQRRREQDLRKLKKLCDDYPGVVEILRATGNPISTIDLRLNLPTAPSAEYPKTVQLITDLTIELPARYPLPDAEPKITITTPVWNPNIYSSGVVCHGKHWLATEGLDLMIYWVMRLLVFDPEILFPQSPANAEAARWYELAVNLHPQKFPTVDLAASKVKHQSSDIQSWKPIPTDSGTFIVMCPLCQTLLRVEPTGLARIVCVKCGASFSGE
jgi:hypothetical protein